MEEAYKAGKVRAIGISNFYPDRYLDLVHFAEVTPAVNQEENTSVPAAESHQRIPGKTQYKIMSWGPFAEGRNDYFNTPALKEIGEKYGKTPAQVALRFLIQSGVV